MTRHQAIARQCAVGVPHSEIAKEFGITVSDVLRIDAKQREIQAIAARRRKAEPLPGLKALDWKTTRPAEDRIRRGEPCRAPNCAGTVERGSYCGHCAPLMYAPRAA